MDGQPQSTLSPDQFLVLLLHQVGRAGRFSRELGFELTDAVILSFDDLLDDREIAEAFDSPFFLALKPGKERTK